MDIHPASFRAVSVKLSQSGRRFESRRGRTFVQSEYFLSLSFLVMDRATSCVHVREETAELLSR